MHKQMNTYVTIIENESIVVHTAHHDSPTYLSYTKLMLIILRGQLVTLMTAVSPVAAMVAAMAVVAAAFRRGWDNDCRR